MESFRYPGRSISFAASPGTEVAEPDIMDDLIPEYDLSNWNIFSDAEMHKTNNDTAAYANNSSHAPTSSRRGSIEWAPAPSVTSSSISSNTICFSGEDPNPWYFGNEMTINGRQGWRNSAPASSHLGPNISNNKERKHECEVCGKHYSLAKNMHRHRKTHKSEASQEKHSCDSYADLRSLITLKADKDSSFVAQGHSKSSHISTGVSSLARDSFGVWRLSTPHEKDEDMVSVGPMEKLADSFDAHQDTTCQSSDYSYPHSEFTNLWTNATMVPHRPRWSTFKKLQISTPLDDQSLSSKSKENLPVISTASTLLLTPKVDKVEELLKIESAKTLESKSFSTGTLATSIPNPEPLEQEVSGKDLLKYDSVEGSTDVQKERHVPAEEPNEISNIGSPETDGYQTTTESFSGDSDVTERSNSVYRELCTVTEENASGRQELLVSSLDPMRQAVVDRVMEEFQMMFNQSWDADFRKCAGAPASPSNAQDSSGKFTSESSSEPGSKKRQREDSEPPDDKNNKDSRGPGGSRCSIGSNSGVEGITRFACPFRKHSTRLYSVYSHPICALSHWETIARVKCWKIFKSQEQLDSHLTVATSDICDLQPGHSPEGINPEQERRLRSKKKTSPNQSEVDRWKDIYKLLFPDEDIPSPYFEPLQEEAAMSPDSRDLASYEDYIRRELPRLVRSNIEEAVRREMQPLEASLVNNLVGIIQDCQDRVFRSYRETQGLCAEPQIQQSIDPEAALSLMPPDGHQDGLGSSSRPLNTSSGPQSNFIDTIFRTPPQSSESILSDLAGIDSRSHLAMQSSDVFLSDSGYASEQLQLCGCSGPCSCGITHSGEQEDNTTQEIEDGNLQWNNWSPRF
ncbi:hypothetical protein N431DRAFT_553166 [Stipitochalara longipes BDJ]|nr:hypothetical protein N431DRAFT_553166 [Stipitochalara longipes BDJ]